MESSAEDMKSSEINNQTDEALAKIIELQESEFIKSLK